MRKLPPIRCWTEPVDHEMVAAHARVRILARGYVRGLSVFVLVPGAVANQGRELAATKLKKTVAEQHYGWLPSICPVQEIDRLGVC